MVARHELGPLEMRVLGLFENEEPRSVGEIRKRLQDRGSQLAYTTVMTVLSRLHDKGVLVRKREGRRFLYALSGQSAEKTGRLVARIHRALFRTVRMQPLAALIEDDELSTAELQELRKLVDDKLKERKR
jgi:predicted transcriptional regulator